MGFLGVLSANPERKNHVQARSPCWNSVPPGPSRADVREAGPGRGGRPGLVAGGVLATLVSGGPGGSAGGPSQGSAPSAQGLAVGWG